jgi:HAD superfamily hydrolase (TIGR01490 family)
MARRFAFFDVDETLISLKSMFDFLPRWSAQRGASQQTQELTATLERARASGTSREELNRLYYRGFRGASLAELTAAGRRWFEERFERGEPPYHREVVARLIQHRVDGIEPVLVSGSMPPLLQPIAEQLGVPHCLCTQLRCDERGVLTGEIGAPQTIGAGKATALRAFLAHHGAEARDCFAYGDDVSDAPMLEAVGAAVAVGASPALIALAQQRGWARLPLEIALPPSDRLSLLVASAERT